MATWSDLLLASAVAYTVYQFFTFYRVRNQVKNIPTIGSDHFFFSYISAWRHIFDRDCPFREGYRKYPGSVFKIPTLTTSSRWMILVNGEKLIEDLKKAPGDVLSFNETAVDILQTQYLFGRHARANDFQVGVIRSSLTRTFPSRFSDIRDEIAESCKEYLPASSDWESRVMYEALVSIACRTTNRLFVGLPLCREPEYRKIQEEWTIKVMVSAHILHLIPSFMKPIAGYLLSPAKSSTKRVEQFVGPAIAERLEKKAQYGSDWEGKPSDLISWLVDFAPPEHQNVEDITFRMMLVNFAAIHTTSLTLTNTLFDLAARQEYIQPLRAEMEEAIANHGWTKQAMGKMRKLDSFIKESGRLGGMASVASARTVMKDFTLSNGITVPAGHTVAVTSAGIHSDPELYEDPEVFNGFRFSDMREKGTNEYDPLRHQMVSLDPTYLLFGHGRHACPGRFFAVNEVKAMTAQILLNYDIKLPGDSTKAPEGFWFDGNRGPSKGRILFRKRNVE